MAVMTVSIGSATPLCCYSCCASQERGCVVLGYVMTAASVAASARREKNKKVYGVPMTPQVFFQPLHSHLAYPGFSKQ